MKINFYKYVLMPITCFLVFCLYDIVMYESYSAVFFVIVVVLYIVKISICKISFKLKQELK